MLVRIQDVLELISISSWHCKVGSKTLMMMMMMIGRFCEQFLVQFDTEFKHIIIMVLQ